MSFAFIIFILHQIYIYFVLEAPSFQIKVDHWASLRYYPSTRTNHYSSWLTLCSHLGKPRVLRRPKQKWRIQGINWKMWRLQKQWKPTAEKNTTCEIFIPRKSHEIRLRKTWTSILQVRPFVLLICFWIWCVQFLQFDRRVFLVDVFSQPSFSLSVLWECVETVEGDIRKDQHNREIKYKETGREQKKKNMDVNGKWQHANFLVSCGW